MNLQDYIAYFLVLVAAVLSTQFIFTDAASSASFLASHTIGLNEFSPRWKKVDWTNWLERTANPRYEKAQGLSPGKGNLQKKKINSVIPITAPGELKSAFTGSLTKYTGSNVWSNRKMEVYVLFGNGQTITSVYRCSAGRALYVAATLDSKDGIPLHFAAADETQVTGGNSNYNYKEKCTEIN